jgi:hypothetical protein
LAGLFLLKLVGHGHILLTRIKSCDTHHHLGYGHL